METKNIVLSIFGVAAGCLLVGLLGIALIGLIGFGAFINRETPQVQHADTFIEQYIPPSAKVIMHHDDHGFGDGRLWQIYELDEQARINFEARIENDPNWKALPLPEELAKMTVLHNDFPRDLAEGYYFLHDFQPQWYPESHHNKRPIWDRPSFNFIIILYDSTTGRIYVDNEDT